MKRLSEIERLYAFTGLTLARQALGHRGDIFLWEDEFAARQKLSTIQLRKLRQGYDIKVLEMTGDRPFGWNTFYLLAAQPLDIAGFYSEAEWCWRQLAKITRGKFHASAESLADACGRRARHQLKFSEAESVGV